MQTIDQKNIVHENDYPLVTAIITTHNRKELLIGAVNSVLRQTYSNIELIVVDDASTDGTCEALNALSEQKNFRYFYISPDESKGGNHARNIGIINANGKYVAFLDDDDEWFPKKIEKQVSLLEKKLECKVCHCGRDYEYNFCEKCVHTDVNKLMEGDLSRLVFTHIQCVTSTMLVEKNFLISIGMFDENLRYWQEYELCMRMFQYTSVACVRENLVLYRVILTDKNRLSNNVCGWENAVEYVYQKHSDIINRLPKDVINKMEEYRYRDGVRRCSACGDRKKQRVYLWKTFKYSHKSKDLLKAILNVNGIKEKYFMNK